MKLTGFLSVTWVVLLGLSIWGCGGLRGSRATDKVYLHEVESGETLEYIAEEYYGDPERAERISDFNEIHDGELQPGMVLRVPMSEKDVEHLKTREQARVPYNAGLALAEQGSYLDAMGQFQESLSIDPDFADAHYNLGVTYQKVKSYERALDEFRESVRLRADNAAYQFALGNAYFHLQRYKEATKAFAAVMERVPGHTKAQYSLAVSYEKLGMTAEAKTAWQHYLELDNTSVWAVEARKHLKNLK